MGHAGRNGSPLDPRGQNVLTASEGTVAFPTGDCPVSGAEQALPQTAEPVPWEGAYLPDEVDMGTGVSFDRFDLTETE